MLDGNGRWAKKRGLPRSDGHRAGGENVRRIVRFCGDIGVKYLTLFGFSTENWYRPLEEVQTLLDLLYQYLSTEVEELKESNVRLITCGRMDEMPSEIREAAEKAKRETASSTGLVLNLAINYGGRREILDALEKARKSGLQNLTMEKMKEYLYCPDIPFPDLLIRTSGEQRISNFLLWQASNSYFWITSTLWPDFSPDDLASALLDYSRFWGIGEQN